MRKKTTWARIHFSCASKLGQFKYRKRALRSRLGAGAPTGALWVVSRYPLFPDVQKLPFYGGGALYMRVHFRRAFLQMT